MSLRVFKQEVPWLLTVLRRVRERPAMYLGDERLGSLECYIQGVIYGLNTLAGVSDSGDVAFLTAFGEWLGKKVKSNNGDCWFYLSLTPGHSGTANDFFEHLDLFLADSGFAGLQDEGLEFASWQIPNSPN